MLQTISQLVPCLGKILIPHAVNSSQLFKIIILRPFVLCEINIRRVLGKLIRKIWENFLAFNEESFGLTSLDKLIIMLNF